MKNTSVALGEHFERFVAGQVASGRYRSASEVLRDALRLLEERNKHRDAVMAALTEGEQSGISDRTPEDIRAAVKQDLPLDGAYRLIRIGALQPFSRRSQRRAGGGVRWKRCI